MSEKKTRIIFRIEIDTLFDETGNLSHTKMDHLAMVCTNLRNAGVDVLMVSSGAIMLGTAKLGLPAPPTELIAKQAVAAVGQADLMKLYQLFFDSFDQIVAQVLVTRDVIKNPIRNKNARKTLEKLLEKGIIPIINENDSVSTDDIILNNNYPITLIVAELIHPDAIVIKLRKSDTFRILIKNHPIPRDIDEDELFNLCHDLPVINKETDTCQAHSEMINGFPETVSDI